jgi:hypothetical protein
MLRLLSFEFLFLIPIPQIFPDPALSRIKIVRGLDLLLYPEINFDETDCRESDDNRYAEDTENCA